MGLTAELSLQITLAIAAYCSGELTHKPGLSPERTCFNRIWECAHNTKDASSIPFILQNCINAEVNKKDTK